MLVQPGQRPGGQAATLGSRVRRPPAPHTQADVLISICSILLCLIWFRTTGRWIIYLHPSRPQHRPPLLPWNVLQHFEGLALRSTSVFGPLASRKGGVTGTPLEGYGQRLKARSPLGGSFFCMMLPFLRPPHPAFIMNSAQVSEGPTAPHLWEFPEHRAYVLPSFLPKEKLNAGMSLQGLGESLFPNRDNKAT